MEKMNVIFAFKNRLLLSLLPYTPSASVFSFSHQDRSNPLIYPANGISVKDTTPLVIFSGCWHTRMVKIAKPKPAEA